MNPEAYASLNITQPKECTIKQLQDRDWMLLYRIGYRSLWRQCWDVRGSISSALKSRGGEGRKKPDAACCSGVLPLILSLILLCVTDHDNLGQILEEFYESYMYCNKAYTEAELLPTSNWLTGRYCSYKNTVVSIQLEFGARIAPLHPRKRLA